MAASKCHIHFSRINVELFFLFFKSDLIVCFCFVFVVNISVFLVSVALPCIPVTPVSADTFLKVLELLPLESLSAILEYRSALQQQQKSNVSFDVFCRKKCSCDLQAG